MGVGGPNDQGVSLSLTLSMFTKVVDDMYVYYFEC